ncbi:MAG: efflux RND transporter periplasmic adaptor subunit, partial [Rhodobacteraceae bacterium]
MRIVSILTAVVVMAVLYLGVFERDRLLDFASGDDAPATTET